MAVAAGPAVGSEEQRVATITARWSGEISVADADLEHYGHDWSPAGPPRAAAIAFPKSTAEVSSLLRLCHGLGVAVVPSGGRTGLAGGAVATHGEVVLSLERMRHMGPVDPISQTVHVQAGAITESVHEHAEPHGLTWPVDLAAKGSSQVGGNIATNAGGIRVIRYGNTREWVLGLTVVLADGTIIEVPPLHKNNTGLDLKHLFIGTEGTLGIVTEATLKLAPLPKRVDTFLFALKDIEGALTILREVRSAGLTPCAFEVFSQACVARLERHRGLRPPVEEAPQYAVLDVEGADPAALEAWIGSLIEGELIVDGTLAADRAQA
ncbi:MAG: FAD-binding oxidoreductase, partial [Myxococcales bacterium]|nr:FAD-binding oxidoreductase [Myxococcales bacterium]